MSDLKAIIYPDTPFPLQEHLVFLARRGSEAHGTYVPPQDPSSIDDRDLMGVVIPPTTYYLGLDSWEHAEEINDPWDVVLYDYRKFVRLLCKQNPNVLSMLWLHPDDYLYMAPAGRALVQYRELFRARDLAYEAFCGYAYGQLKRITSFGQFKGYMGAKRKKLVEKFGYDTKNASHLIRLLRMGEEFLRTGTMTVRRPDAQELIEIKQGRFKLEEIQDAADTLFKRCADARDQSPLPNTIDMAAVNALMIGTMQEHGWRVST